MVKNLRFGCAAVFGLALIGSASAQSAGVSATTGAGVSSSGGDSPTVNAGASTQVAPQGGSTVVQQPSTSGVGSVDGGGTAQTVNAGASTQVVPPGGSTVVQQPSTSGVGGVETAMPSTGLPAGSDVAAGQAASPDAGPVPAAYLTGMVRVPQAEFEGFLSNPSSLLSTYPDAGIPMSNYVRLLAGSDNRAVPVLISLAADPLASPSHVAFIGAGLARAAQGGQVSAPEYAAYIQQQVAESLNSALISAFSTALSEQATAALGFGAGGGGGGGGPGSLGGGGNGGTVNGAPNSPIAQNFLSRSFRNVGSVTEIGGSNGGTNGPTLISSNGSSPSGGSTNSVVPPTGGGNDASRAK